MLLNNLLLKNKLIFVGLALVLCVVSLLSLSFGALNIPLKQVALNLAHHLGVSTTEPVDELYSGVMDLVRWPRTLLGILVGAALGMSGAAIQAIFRNPLAEPGLIGISAGASLMAATIIAFEFVFFSTLGSLFGHYLLAAGAFLGAGIATLLVYRISLHHGKPHIGTMILAGVAINALAGSLTGLISFASDEQQLRSITFWMLGSLGNASWYTIWTILPFVALALVGLPLLAKALNSFSLGEQEAQQLGQNPQQNKLRVIVLATLAVGATVSVAGIIGFVGLLVPHAVRMVGGSDNRYVLPASALLGSIILTVADLIARTIVAPSEIPIGVVTALLGTPLFLFILIRDKKKFAA
ncbi:iron complex transport system permease protein [Sphingobacterium psychroaquaticum]|uniref:Iron complex transport system permease protein n=1 Tax=Sphingobacterium psychroaquaticum TaxID=561061 RepID=A0A1X7HVN5_9SPHI|nr:iron complex transport system permease protein [Sphingobacterium psychroaquaticum]